MPLLHGSPRIHESRYEDDFLDDLSSRIAGAAQQARMVWSIFDNTASGAAIPNATGLAVRLAERTSR